MCRADITPAAQPALAALLNDFADALAERTGCSRANVHIGPDPHEEGRK